MPRVDELEDAKLKALVDRVMDAYGELDDRLGSGPINRLDAELLS